MGPTNGNGTTPELGIALERIIAAFARINTALRSLLERILRLSDSLDASSERREKEHEIIRARLDDINSKLVIISSQLNEARSDIRDVTPPLGVALQNPAFDSRYEKKNDSGALVAFARVAEKVPSSWVGWVLKLGVPTGLGAAALRAIQWLTTGH